MLCILFYYIIQVSKGHKAYVLAYWRDDLLIRHNIREYKAYNSPLKRIKSYCSPYLQRKDGGKHMIRFILIVLFLGIFFISSILTIRSYFSSSTIFPAICTPKYIFSFTLRQFTRLKS